MCRWATLTESLYILLGSWVICRVQQWWIIVDYVQ